MKILVIGGMHGNEPLGIEVVKLIKAKPLKNVYIVLANKRAVAQNSRFVKQDLNRLFPGNIEGGNYEEKRAAQLLKLCSDYDLVLDFHNTHCADNDCSFIGANARKYLPRASSYLGLSRIIVANYECINKYAKNCLSVEISLDSKECNSELWYKKIQGLSILELKDLPEGENQLYKFTYRMTLEDRDRLDLPSKKLEAFKPISKKLASAMEVQTPAYPIFIGDGYTPYNYGGLVNRLDV